MTDSPQEPQFLNVPALLAASRPRQPVNWLVYCLAAVLLLTLLAGYAEQAPKEWQGVIQGAANLLMLALLGATTLMWWLTMQRARGMQRDLESVEEMIQLRRWPEAAELLGRLLSRPTRAPQMRVQALVYLAAVLGRYHRHGDAATVYEHLLTMARMDDESAHGLRLGRAMALLHEDRLFDADRAIIELRRGPRGGESGGLALVEIYRDVKTGHPSEAIDLFNERLAHLRRDLGIRLADAYALVARAYDLLDRAAEAQAAWERATLLSVPQELSRRYPEVAPLFGKYTAVTRPAEAA